MNDSGFGRLRPWLILAHKTIGLTLGAIFVMIGLSGAILVYREDLDEWLNPDLLHVEPGSEQNHRSIDDIFNAARGVMPPEAKSERITLSRHPMAATVVTYISETDDLDTFVHDVFVDPYRAKVKGQRLKIHGDDRFSQPWIPLLMDFHWTLLLGANKAFLIGAIAIFILLSMLIGFILWWPVNGNWRLGLKIKWPATKQRVIFDLHRVTGFYLGSILLMSLFTGAAMIFKPVTRDVVSLVSPVTDSEDFGKSRLSASAAPISVGAAVRIADKVFPEGKLHWILLPTNPTGVYIVGKRSAEEPNRSQTFRNVGIDQYSGVITRVQDRDTYQLGDKFIEWLFPLHSGEVLGMVGRSVYVFVGLSPLVLFATGLSRWLMKRRTRGV